MIEYEEQQIIRWVYLIARHELENVQRCIGKIQSVDIGGKEIEQVLIMLLQFEKTIKQILLKIKRRMPEEGFCSMIESVQKLNCAMEMEKRVTELKRQIHTNRKAGIFAWGLAKDLIEFEEKLMFFFARVW